MKIKVTENHKPKAKTNWILKIIIFTIVLIFIIYLYFKLTGTNTLVNNIPVRHSIFYNTINKIEHIELSDRHQYCITFNGEKSKDPLELWLMSDKKDEGMSSLDGEYMMRIYTRNIIPNNRAYDVTLKGKLKRIICKGIIN